jgi:RimJ/RimL family protein N-acetyltransferase
MTRRDGEDDGMELWRARIEADDTPGQLAAVAGALGGVGANIVSLDVHAIGASRVADDLVVAVDGTLDAAAFNALLAPLDAGLVDLRRADAHELVDPVTQAVEAAGGVMRARASVGALAGAIAQVVPVELAYVRPAAEGLPLTGVGARALAEGRAVLGREPVKSLPAGPDGAWVLAAPVVLEGRAHVGVAVRRTPRFSFTETARLRAVLGVGALATSQEHHPGAGTVERVQLRDGGEVDLRALLAEDEAAVVRMHARCSPATTQRRYFSGMRAIPPGLLRLLMDVDGHRRVGVVAAIGSELVGVAHLDLPGDGTGEVAVLVEDAHQRRGIGGTLLHRCVRAAAIRDVGAISAVCLTDNVAFPQLVARCGYHATTTLDDGLRHLTFPVARTSLAGALPADAPWGGRRPAASP